MNVWNGCMIAWWLEHVDVITSLQFLRTYTGCLLVNKWYWRWPWRSGSVSTVLLQPTSATSAYLQQPRLVNRTWHSASNRILLVPRVWSVAGQWSFTLKGPTTWNSLPCVLRAPELSQNAFIRALKTHCSRPPGSVETFLHDSGAGYKYTDWLIYLLNSVIACWLITADTVCFCFFFVEVQALISWTLIQSLVCWM